jgi:hypothetical protein
MSNPQQVSTHARQVAGRVVVGVALAVCAGSAAAQAATATGSGERTERMAPGAIVEWCAELAKGQRASYRFEADAPVDFNIHAHEGDKVIYPVKRAAQRRQAPARFTAPTATAWCWMWTNGGKAETQVRYAITLEASR